VVLSIFAVGLVVSCGSGDGEDQVISGAQEVNADGPTSIIAGQDAFLILEPRTRDAQELTTDGRRLATADLGAIPGEGSLINTTGVQIDSDRWLIAGNDCDTSEDVNPANCDPGTLTVGIVEGSEWTLLENVPREFSHAFVSIVSLEGSTVLLSRWEEGASQYWTLDLDRRAFIPIDWAPAPHDLGDDVVTDQEVEDPRPNRTACIAGERLLVLDSVPDGNELTSQLTTVDLAADTSRPVSQVALQLEPSTVPTRLLCDGGPVPYVIAADATSSTPVAFEISGEGAGVGAAQGAETGTGSIIGTSFGQGVVTFQRLTGEPTTRLSEPNSTEGAGTAETTAPTEAIVFREGSWETIPLGNGPLAGKVHATATSGQPLVASSPAGQTYQVVGG
jgi:hypothetical protein